MHAAADPTQHEAKADTTPMIDVVFLLIVFFLCIDFRVLEAKLPAWLPTDRGRGPCKVEPQEQLSLQIRVRTPGRRVYPAGGATDPGTGRPHRFVLVGHEVEWNVGGWRIDSHDDLLAELKRIHDDRSLWQPDATRPGRLKPMPVVVEPYPGTCYDDAATAADAAKSAGFTEIHFGGGLGALPLPR